ncbi:532_t:CDS:1, partial [Dentiscutata heterogama]
LAKANQNIHETIAKVKKLKKELQSADSTTEELKNKLYNPNIELKFILLD